LKRFAMISDCKLTKPIVPLSKNGDSTYENTNRQYYTSRFNGDKLGDYLAHDDIDNNYVCLGSWYNCVFKLLVKHRIF
jgi:hypothetical protein